MMVYIHRGREGGKLPHRREELYRLCITLLLELWQRSKNINLLDELHITGEQLEKALQEVAFAAHKDQPTLDKTADISGELLAGKLYKYRGQDTAVDPDRLIEYVRDRAGLLQQHHTKASEDDDDLYRFPHRTFQEYLAGLYLLRYDFPKELARLSRQDPNRWREALLLAAASQRHVPYTVWALIEKLCPEPPPPPDQAQTDTIWGAFLAGQIFVETDLLNPEITLDEDEIKKKEHIRQWQKTIVSGGLLPPRDRAQAGDVLAALDDDRPGVLFCDEMPLCYVPSGEFWMGDEQKHTKGHWNNSLDKPYWLAQYPVTVAQFREFVQSSSHRPAYGDRPLSAPENRPVVFVNWYDALAFCDWLNQRWRPHLPPGYCVTLPGEAEWEKAARGGRVVPVAPYGTTVHSLKATLDTPPAVQPNQRDGRDLSQREYPWGDEAEQEETQPELYRANSKVAGIDRASAVGSFPAGASPLGCLEMSGNVWEWTRSLWGKDYQKDSYVYPYQPAEREDLKAGQDVLRVLRGGAYYVNSPGFSARVRYSPPSLRDGGGFRVAVSPFVSDR
jgi:formylglycine-generating enzyme required for sulfatase activity